MIRNQKKSKSETKISMKSRFGFDDESLDKKREDVTKDQSTDPKLNIINVQSVFDKTSNTNLAEKIKKELVDTNYYDDVKYNIRSKSRWKVVSDVSEALSHLFTGIATILAFAAGFFNFALLSFIAGCFGTISLVLLRFSSYAAKESRERTKQVNMLLDGLGIRELTDITSASENTTNTGDV